MGVAGMMSLSGAVVMAGTAGTLFGGALYTHAHVRALIRYVRTCVWKNAGCIYCTFCTCGAVHIK